MTLDFTPAVCAVVVTYGDVGGVSRCIKSLRDCSSVSGVVVVDNKGDLAIEAVCSDLGAMYIDPGANIGYARGANLGIESFQGEVSHVLIVNPDLVLHDLLPVLRALNESGAAVATGCMHGTDRSLELNARVIATPLRELLSAAFGTRVYNSPAPELDGGIDDVEQAAGSLLLIPMHIWDDLGGFDERFELYFEDVDLCRRAHVLGGVVRVRTVVADHVGGASYDANRRQAYVALRVSRLRYLQKWYGIRGEVMAFLFTIVELVSRGVTRQAEGWRARIHAITTQAREISAPGSVRSLSRRPFTEVDLPGS